MRNPLRLIVGPVSRSFALLALLVLLSSACAAGQAAPQTKGSSASDLSVGVFGECELPTPLQPLLDKLGQALGGRGIEISGEAILVYDHDLACGGNTLELLLGGDTAWALGGALGLAEGNIKGMLDELSGTAGLLVTATVGLDFGGNWEGIHFALDGYVGGDVFGVGGGRWKVLWSTDPTEVGQEGFWASITVGSDGACSAGGVVFGSDSDVSVLKSAWDHLIGEKNPNPPAPCNAGASSGSSGAGANAGAGASAGAGAGAGADAGASADAGADADAGASADAGPGYAFVSRKSEDRHHPVYLRAGASEIVPFTWQDASGAQPAADLWVDASGKTLLQVSSVGGRPFARAGLDVVPLSPDARYELVLTRGDDGVRVSLAEAGKTLLRTHCIASDLDVVTPGSAYRASVSSRAL